MAIVNFKFFDGTIMSENDGYGELSHFEFGMQFLNKNNHPSPQAIIQQQYRYFNYDPNNGTIKICSTNPLEYQHLKKLIKFNFDEDAELIVFTLVYHRG